MKQVKKISKKGGRAQWVQTILKKEEYGSAKNIIIQTGTGGGGSPHRTGKTIELDLGPRVRVTVGRAWGGAIWLRTS